MLSGGARSSLRPRAETFAADGLLGTGLGQAIADECPADDTASTVAAAPHAGVFGSILKFVKAIRRLDVNGFRAPGAPLPDRFALHRVNVGSVPPFGPLTKVPFVVHYDLRDTTTARALTAGPPPQLIVTLLDGEGAPDHFEIDLDPVPEQNDVQIEIEFQDFKTCAFTLGFAARVDGVVSAYTPVVFVPEPTTGVATPVTTPTVTPPRTPTPTRTPTTTATPPAALRVFVTSTTQNGNLGGLGGADAICAARAAAAGLTGVYKAWLSDASTAVGSRITRAATIPYRRLDGAMIAANWQDLTDGVLAAPIDKDENGATVTGDVWTDATIAGAIDAAECLAWTGITTGFKGQTGASTATNAAWTHDVVFEDCAQSRRLYCFEQSSVIPTVTPSATAMPTRTPTPTPTKTPFCGNGSVEPPETCDPPGVDLACVGTAACGSDCRCVSLPPPPVCGDGVCDPGEECGFPDPGCGPAAANGCCCADCGCGGGCAGACSGADPSAQRCLVK